METCGDGFVVGLEGCDDANLDNGDGCSSSCVVETGWTCVTKTKPTLITTYCYETQWPHIIDYWMDDVDMKLYIKWNETILVSGTWVSSDWNLNLTGPFYPYNYTWELDGASSLTTTAL